MKKEDVKSILFFLLKKACIIFNNNVTIKLQIDIVC
jgi:hypothetical protein